MLTLNEHIEITEKLNLFEGESPQFTDEQIDKSVMFDIKYNPISGGIDVTLYDIGKNSLGTVTFDDAEIATAFLEELFDLDPEDVEWLDSYAWANPTSNKIEQDEDNFDERVNDTLDLLS